MRKMATERLHQTFAHGPWKVSEAVTLLIGHITGVAGEQLVATVARKHNLDVFAREFRNHVGGNRRRIGEGLVEMPDQFVNQLTNIGSDDEFVMLGPKSLRRDARIPQLVITVFMKTNRESLDGSAAVLRHQTYDSARINPAGKKRSQRHVRN